MGVFAKFGLSSQIVFQPRLGPTRRLVMRGSTGTLTIRKVTYCKTTAKERRLKTDGSCWGKDTHKYCVPQLRPWFIFHQSGVKVEERSM